MPTDPDDSAMSDPLPEVSLSDLLERARLLAPVSKKRGELMVSLKARGLTWRRIEEETGIPYATAWRWAREYLEGQ